VGWAGGMPLEGRTAECPARPAGSAAAPVPLPPPRRRTQHLRLRRHAVLLRHHEQVWQVEAARGGVGVGRTVVAAAAAAAALLFLVLALLALRLVDARQLLPRGRPERAARARACGGRLALLALLGLLGLLPFLVFLILNLVLLVLLLVLLRLAAAARGCGAARRGHGDQGAAAAERRRRGGLPPRRRHCRHCGRRRGCHAAGASGAWCCGQWGIA
jgi:hypothetical protein